MTKQRLRLSRLVSVATLIVSLSASGVARADDLSIGKPFRVRAVAFAPIGKVYSLGEISINGRAAYGEQPIWGGELLRASDDSTACVMLDSIGQVRLTPGAVVRLATQLTMPTDDPQRPVLIATLLVGDMMVKLQQEAIAYIETCGSAYTSSSGASFRIAVRNGHPVIDAGSGTVRLEAESSQINCAIRSVTIDGNRRVTGPAPDRLRVQRGTAQNINLQYTCNGKPVRGQPVLITVKKNIGKIGSQSITRPTDDIEGVVTVTFTAGGSPNSSDITANAPGSTVPRWTGHITIPGFWTPRNKLLVVAAIAFGTFCIIGCGGGEKPLIQVPPPTIP
ncbi:MAG: hypothetical protein AABO41_14125 [Acidobacteriota bacterium]